MATFNNLGDDIALRVLEYAADVSSLVNMVRNHGFADKPLLACCTTFYHWFLQSKCSKRFSTLSSTSCVWGIAFGNAYPCDRSYLAKEFPGVPWKARFRYWKSVQERWQGREKDIQHLPRQLQPVGRPVYCVARVNHDTFVSACADGTLQWGRLDHLPGDAPTSDCETSRREATLVMVDAHATHGSPVMAVCADRFGNCVISGDDSGTVAFTAMDALSTDRILGSCPDKHTLKPESLPTLVKGHAKAVLSISSNATHALSGAADGTAQHWDLSTRSSVGSVSCDSAIYSTAMDLAGRLYTGEKEGTISIWDPETYKRTHHYPGFGRFWVWCMDTADMDACTKALGKAPVLDGMCGASSLMGEIDRALAIGLNITGSKPKKSCMDRWAACSAAPPKPVCGVRKACENIERWSTSLMSRVCPQKRMKCTAGSAAMHELSTGAWDSAAAYYQASLFTGATDGCWRWYDLRSESPAHTIQVDATRCRSANMPVSAIKAMPRRQQVLTCSYDGALRIWDVRTMKPVAEFWHPTKQPLLRCAVMHDAIVVGSVDGSIHAWSFS